MSDDLQQLKDDYRAIEAPAQLAARVLAQVNDRRQGPSWLPGLALAAIALAALGPLLLLQTGTDGDASPSIPSLSQLTPNKPPGSMPSLGSLKSVSLPPLPAKPKPTNGKDTWSQIKDITRKENDYEYA